MRILLVEDEPQLAAQIARALTRADHTVETRHDGEEGLALASRGAFDLIVLDVNLPKLDGFTVLKRLRDAHNHTRVIMLTARGEVGDRVNGLKSGADDYVTKPFAIDELLARVEVLGRRTAQPDQVSLIEVAGLRMDVIGRKVTLSGEPVALSPREFELLRILMQEPGRTFSREEICERIWEREHEYDTRTVEIFVMRLRKKLDGEWIQTVRGVGYLLQPSP